MIRIHAARWVVMLTSAVALLIGQSHAAIVDSHGFEVPSFTTSFGGDGRLEGQTPATPNGTWLRSGPPAGSTATIQTAVVPPVGGGAQAVRVDRAANADTRWAVPLSGVNTAAGIQIDWDMRVQQSVGAANTFGPFFGSEANDATNPSTIGLLGSLGVDATTGEVLYQDTGTGFLIAPGPTVAFGAWNHFTMKLNYTNHTYSIFLNGSQIGSPIGFVDQPNVPGGLNGFTDGDISAIAAAGDPGSAGLPGTAYFDNYIISTIPEPGSALMGLALGTLIVRRRTRRKS